MLFNVEKLSVQRRKMLLGFSFGFGFSLIAVFLRSISSKQIILSNYSIIFVLLALMGWILWFYNLIRILIFQQKLKKDPKLSASLNDEYINFLRLKSFSIAFWSVLILQCPLYIINMSYPLSVNFVILINIFVGVLAAIISFILFDRE